MDAIRGSAGLSERAWRRDVNKARLAFEGARGGGVATGHWGCGAFGGDVALKAMLQWVAASEAGVGLRYHC